MTQRIDTHLDGEGVWSEFVKTHRIVNADAHGAVLHVAGLPNGTQDGRSAVVLGIEMAAPPTAPPDKPTLVVIQTTMRLFLSSLEALKLRYVAELGTPDEIAKAELARERWKPTRVGLVAIQAATTFEQFKPQDPGETVDQARIRFIGEAVLMAMQEK